MSQHGSTRTRGLRVFFWLVIALLIAGIGWQGSSIALSLVRQSNAASEQIARRDAYAGTATAIAIAATPDATAEAVDEAKAGLQLKQDAATPIVQGIATNTPAPALVPVEDPNDGPAIMTNTPEASSLATNTPAPGDVALPTVEGTPRPLPTFFNYGNPEGILEAGGTAVPTEVPPLERGDNDLMNILLMGNDGELTDDGFIRTDTMILVSINRTAGTVSMLSFPRDLYVYIPSWTMQRINVAYTYGESAGWTDGGFGLMRQVLYYNFGINVHYYAMVNLEGFRTIVDAVGGVNIAVDCALQDPPLLEAELPEGAYQVNDEGEYVLPVGVYQMNGAQALWYARSRGSSTDFDRNYRQQQILRAIYRRARETGLLNNVVTLWNEGTQYIETNLTLEDIVGLLPLALNLDPGSIDNFTFVRTYHTTPWQTPDGDYVQLPVSDTVRQLMEDFYSPPTQNQIAVEGARVAVYNGTTNANWDRIAAGRLEWDGFNAVAVGTAPEANVTDTILIDYTGRTKGSSLEQIARALNIRPENIRIEPQTEREYDFEVILGSTYNSCTRQGVAPVDEGAGAAVEQPVGDS